jgi:SAM-dependent methyltransferase
VSPSTATEAGDAGGAAPAPAKTPIGLAPGVPLEAAGQDAAKYGSTNPVVVRLLDRFMGRLKEVIGPIEGKVVDVGIGEGLCLERVLRPAEGAPPVDPGVVVGVEYRLDKARAAAQQLPGVEVNVGDAGMLPFPDRAADLVLCIEVLEHLPTVEPAVAELARITGDRCVVSVPWEPWFRLGNLGRGKNIGRLGNDPEHLRAFSPRSLRRTLERSFAEVRIVPVFPWLVAEARRPI